MSGGLEFSFAYKTFSFISENSEGGQSFAQNISLKQINLQQNLVYAVYNIINT